LLVMDCRLREARHDCGACGPFFPGALGLP
jgi:hypothetical protein